MNNEILVVDYQMSNLFSVLRSIEKEGYTPKLTSDPNEIASASALILPGVGAFKAAMDNLKRLDLVDPIIDFIQSGKPFMGVCLGLHLLFEESEEFGSHKGLGIIQGSVKKFQQREGFKEKIPQIQWNNINPSSISWQESPLKGIDKNAWMYFVHSYFVEPLDKNIILSETEYCGINYCSSIFQNNIFATQFHPEKSGKEGLTIYKNWLSRNYE